MKRFTGGGTVVIDKNVLLVSIIAAKVDGVVPYPRSIMSWTEDEVYKPVMNSTCSAGVASAFSHRENDYVFGDVKVGGNAQAISRDRWVHHTSFLWEVCPQSMSYLKMPTRVPDYRAERSHTDFVGGLSERVNVSKSEWFDVVENRLGVLFGGTVQRSWDDVASVLEDEHPKECQTLVRVYYIIYLVCIIINR